jgi:hypothetical protein
MSGVYDIQLEAAARSLADCATFQTLTGAADAAEAYGSIYQIGLPAPSDPQAGYTLTEWQSYRPMAIVYPESGGLQVERTATNRWGASGKVLIDLERDCPSGNVVLDQPDVTTERAWVETIGDLVSELLDVSGFDSGDGTHLAFHRVSVIDGPGAGPPHMVHDYGVMLGATLALEYGVR